MKNLIRCLLFLLFSVEAFAVTTYSPLFAWPRLGTNYSDAAGACKASWPAYSISSTPTASTFSDGSPQTATCMTFNPNTGQNYSLGTVSRQPFCATGDTMNYTTMQCQGVGCPAGTELQSDGSCKAPNPCPAKSGGYGWFAAAVGAPSLESSTYCDNGCMVGLNAPTGSNNPGYSYTNGKVRSQKYEIIYPGAQCSGGTALPAAMQAPNTPTEPPKKPACLPTEGVLTSSTGAIHCVPSGTPGASTPIVNKQATTTTNPDGTKVIEETTTTRDPATGVEDKQTTKTTKDANGNTTGVTSTSSSSGSNSNNPDKPNDSDFCQKNPNLDICTGKLNKEETQKKVADSLSAENFDPESHLPTTMDVSADAKQKADAAKDNVVADIRKFGTSSDPSAGFYQQFKDEMGGWLGDIPITGCTPFSAKIGPYNWSFDHCEKASKIAEIFGYCLWVMLAFGVFSLATRNRGGN